VEERLVVLLLKVAASAALASILIRVGAFKRLLLVEERTLAERARLGLTIAAGYGSGVATRIITGTYAAADVGLEACLTAGLVGGYVPGLLAGVLISLPAMNHHEYLAMPMFALAGLLGGLVRDAASDPEQIWAASPFFDTAIYRAVRNWPDTRELLFQAFLPAVVISLEFLRFWIAGEWADRYLYSGYSQLGGMTAWALAATWFATLLAVMIPIKIWNNARNEKKLEDKERLLQEARLRALTSQINPHFLFNTLNSVASLVRTDPDKARLVIHKLSNILRRLLRKTGDYSSLRDELSFIDDYLSIEMVRFGDKLRFVKEIDGGVLDRMIPSMVLQPIVENSLKHGLANKVEGGTIRLTVSESTGGLSVTIEDDGVGIPESNLAKLFEQGIGISNVNERLKVLFGTGYKMWIDSKPGEGTKTGIEIPTVAPGLAQAS
jgi:two-component system LytT family sensor kinase